ncbi:MAG: hypothetical protein K2M19_07500 [Muribaculaceae bacterium]|nr:hypothetical protein [Muribaculaceae bacterium]
MTETSSSRNAAMTLLGSLGLLIVAAGTCIPLINGGFPTSPAYKIIYTAGAVICLIASLFNPAPKSVPLRQRRWKRIENWSSIFFCVACFFLWYPHGTPRDWLAFTMAGAIIRVIVYFASFKKAK